MQHFQRIFNRKLSNLELPFHPGLNRPPAWPAVPKNNLSTIDPSITSHGLDCLMGRWLTWAVLSGGRGGNRWRRRARRRGWCAGARSQAVAGRVVVRLLRGGGGPRVSGEQDTHSRPLTGLGVVPRHPGAGGLGRRALGLARRQRCDLAGIRGAASAAAGVGWRVAVAVPDVTDPRALGPRGGDRREHRRGEQQQVAEHANCYGTPEQQPQPKRSPADASVRPRNRDENESIYE